MPTFPKRSLAILALIVLSLVSIVPIAQGQSTLGRIEGLVKDAQGGTVSGAQIEVKNVDTNLKISAQTQTNGRYQVANLPVGNYSVTVENAGFEKQVFTAILVEADHSTTVDIQLKVGSVSTLVEVVGTPLRNEVDATNGYTLDSSTIENTPLGTGSFTQLAILAPGVNADFLAGSGSNAGLGNQSIWANGQRDTSNTFTFNGVNANNLFNGKSSSQVGESRYVLNTGQFTAPAGGGEIQTNVTVYNAIG